MADRDFTKRSEIPVGNFAFEVKIIGVSEGEEIKLELPVDAVRGLGDGRTSVIRHRSNGFSADTQTPYPGISTPDDVTLEGSWLYDMADLKLLQEWRNQVKGALNISAFGGIYRDVTIHPQAINDDLNVVEDFPSASSHIKLINAIATRLTVADFDINAPAVSSWSLELAFEDMVIL
jgi:hypothetical protein